MARRAGDRHPQLRRHFRCLRRRVPLGHDRPQANDAPELQCCLRGLRDDSVLWGLQHVGFRTLHPRAVHRRGLLRCAGVHRGNSADAHARLLSVPLGDLHQHRHLLRFFCWVVTWLPSRGVEVAADDIPRCAAASRRLGVRASVAGVAAVACHAGATCRSLGCDPSHLQERRRRLRIHGRDRPCPEGDGVVRLARYLLRHPCNEAHLACGARRGAHAAAYRHRGTRA